MFQLIVQYVAAAAKLYIFPFISELRKPLGGGGGEGGGRRVSWSWGELKKKKGSQLSNFPKHSSAAIVLLLLLAMR